MPAGTGTRIDRRGARAGHVYDVGVPSRYGMNHLAARLDGRRLANYLAVLTLEAQTIARACGKSHLHNLEPEDLVALTIEAAAMAGVPLAGTSWVPGQSAF